MGTRTRADLSVLLKLFRIERGKGAFRRVGCIELRYNVSGAYVITVPCTVRPVVKRQVGGGGVAGRVGPGAAMSPRTCLLLAFSWTRFSWPCFFMDFLVLLAMLFHGRLSLVIVPCCLPDGYPCFPVCAAKVDGVRVVVHPGVVARG